MTDAIENVSEGFSLYDADQRLILCNAKFREIYGYSVADVAGHPTIIQLLALDMERGNIDKKAGGFDVNTATRGAVRRRRRNPGPAAKRRPMGANS